jgi:hypothetical protein
MGSIEVPIDRAHLDEEVRLGFLACQYTFTGLDGLQEALKGLDR